MDGASVVEMLASAGVGSLPTLMLALRAYAQRNAAVANLEEAKAEAVKEATAALKITAEQAQSLAREALEEARRAREESKRARDDERKCSALLGALRSEFDELCRQVRGSPRPRNVR